MDDRDRLAFYPFAMVGLPADSARGGASYRLARLAAKFGPEISLRDLTDRFSYDCLWRTEARSKKGKSACGVYLPDLEHKRPPDLPPGMVKTGVSSRKDDTGALASARPVTARNADDHVAMALAATL